MDMNSLSHTKWECKYHIVFALKFRRKIAYYLYVMDYMAFCQTRVVVHGEYCEAKNFENRNVIRLMVMYQHKTWWKKNKSKIRDRIS